MSSELEVEQLIIFMAKSSECLYNKKHADYYKPAEKLKVYEEMAEFLKMNLRLSLSPEDVKKKWENLRKSFYNAHRTGRTNHIHYQELIFLKDYISITKNNASKSALDKGLDKEKTQLNIFDKFNSSDKLTISPPADKFAIKKKDQLQKLENKLMEVANCTLQSISEDEKQINPYEISIKQGLRTLKEGTELECVIEILETIKKYQKESK